MPDGPYLRYDDRVPHPERVYLFAPGMVQQIEAYTASAPTQPDSLAGQIWRPWRHVPNSVSEQKLKRDKAKCEVVAHRASVAPDSDPEIKLIRVFSACMEAEGYEPEPAR